VNTHALGPVTPVRLASGCLLADQDNPVPMPAESAGSLVLLSKQNPSAAAWARPAARATKSLRGKFDAAIKSMQCDGTLDAMIVKPEYFGPEAKTWGDAGKEGC